MGLNADLSAVKAEMDELWDQLAETDTEPPLSTYLAELKRLNKKLDYYEELKIALAEIDFSESTAIYFPFRDGQLMKTKSMTPAQAFWSIAMLPGWQKWMPTYRFGTISDISIGENTCSVDLSEALSSQQNINVNQSNSLLTEVPVSYMTCNAGAFTDGDIVLVEFVGRDFDSPCVIGFKENPASCTEVDIAILSYLTSDGKTKNLIINLFTGTLFPVVSSVEDETGSFTELTQPFEEDESSGLSLGSVLEKNSIEVISPAVTLMRAVHMSYLYFPRYGYPNAGFEGFISGEMSTYSKGIGGEDPDCYEVENSEEYQELYEFGYIPDEDTPSGMNGFCAYETDFTIEGCLGTDTPLEDYWTFATWEGRLFMLLPEETNRRPLIYETQYKKTRTEANDGKITFSVIASGGSNMSNTLSYETEGYYSDVSGITDFAPTFMYSGRYNPTNRSATYLEGCYLEHEDEPADYIGAYYHLHYWLQYQDDPDEPAKEIDRVIDLSIYTQLDGDSSADITNMVLEVRKGFL